MKVFLCNEVKGTNASPTSKCFKTKRRPQCLRRYCGSTNGRNVSAQVPFLLLKCDLVLHDSAGGI